MAYPSSEKYSFRRFWWKFIMSPRISFALFLGGFEGYTVGFKYKGPKVFGDFDQKSLVLGKTFLSIFLT